MKPHHKKEVLDILARTSDVSDVCPIYGDYDIIAKIKANSFASLGRIIVRKILCLESVLGTKTYTVQEN